MLLRSILREELARRRRNNKRYSLRAFARDLRLHHSTLSRVMRGRQHVTQATLSRIASRLGLQHEVVALSESEHAILGAIRRGDFRPESRWIATVTTLSVDVVNAALHRLLRDGTLRMESAESWTIDSTRLR